MSEYFPSPAETSTESDDTGPESSKTKKKKSFEIGKAVAPKIIEAPKIEAPQDSRHADSLIDMLRGNAAGASPAGDKETKKTKESLAVTKAHEGQEKADGAAKAEAADTEVPLESLSRDEQKEAVKRYAEARKEELAAEVSGEEGEETEAVHAAAETAADIALLDAVEAKLEADPEKSIAEAIDEAENEVSDQIEAAAEDAGDAAEDTGNEETVEPAPQPAAAEGEVPLGGDGDEEIVLHPAPTGAASTGGSGGSGGGRASLRPGGTAGGGNAGGNGSGGMPPIGPFGPGFGGAGHSYHNFNAAPAAPQIVEVQDITAERRAMAQGALAGLFVGYLVGRRRGRIKTEKKLMPVQRKLEKQVNQLYGSLAASEQTVRKLAREKSEALAASQTAQQRFTERVAASRPEARTTMATSAERGGDQEPSYRERPDRQSAERTGSSENTAERFSAKVIEAPAVILAAAAALRSERKRETAPAVDFTKKVEQYTPQELDRAAEKIKVDGSTLKEIARAHGLEERAIRRVVGAFIEGGNIKEALSHELVEKELQFERDPKLRQARQAALASGGGAAAVRALQAVADKAGDGAAARGGQNGELDQKSSGKKPTPDQATIDRLRKQQITQISVTAAVVVIFAVIIAVLLG